MSNRWEGRLRDDFETVYQVSHQAKYGFHGNGTVWIAVEEETEEEIRGRKFGPMRDVPGNRITVRKDNVAGWEVDELQYRKIPEEPPKPSADAVRRAYEHGRIDEEGLESGLEEAMADE